MYTSQEIIDLVGEGLTKTQIHAFAEMFRGGRRGRPREEYSTEEVGFVIRMFQASSVEGFSPKDASERIRVHRIEAVADGLLDLITPLAPELVSQESRDFLRVAAVPGNGLNRGHGLDRVAKAGRQLLGADRCSIYLLHQEDLVLVADSQDEIIPARLGFRIRNYQHALGWTSWVARERKPINKVGPELDEAYAAGDEAARPRDRRSLIAIPLPNPRKNQPLWGVIKAQNKSGQRATKLAAFDDQDEYILSALAAMAVPILELQRVLDKSVHVLDQLNNSESFYEFTAEVMDAAMTMTYADRGEFIVWNPERGGVDEKVVGDSELTEGAVHAKEKPGATDKVYWEGKPEFIPDTEKRESGYYNKAHPKTRSETAVPITVGSAPVGVLNLESNLREDEGGQKQTDIALLEVLSAFASTAFQITALRNAPVENLPEGELRAALERAVGIATESAQPMHFVGIAYKPDYRKGCLVLARSLERNEGIEKAQERFAFNPVESLASYVFRAKEGKLIPVPERDSRVYNDGLVTLGVRGSMIGIPIIMGSKFLGPTVVLAVLILWNICEGGTRDRIDERTGMAIINRCKDELVFELKLQKP